ncbi:hypothetical protein DdX_15498 [Ditylenchus destructor]|uniref:Uncharacterized protein n=1 Tax=Ditylenchus destructor TaxID=166010 RepID=A0AAD4R0R4_9BILA|nr:hypothetical protein DdX_15498 [Ditylenchus destructor]
MVGPAGLNSPLGEGRGIAYVNRTASQGVPSSSRRQSLLIATTTHLRRTFKVTVQVGPNRARSSTLIKSFARSYNLPARGKSAGQFSEKSPSLFLAQPRTLYRRISSENPAPIQPAGYFLFPHLNYSRAT